MEELRERVKMFCENPFFQERPALVVALLSLETEMDVKLPNAFDAVIMPEYEFGERKISIGKIHKFYFFGMDFEDGHWEYRAFENKQSFKLFFAQMKELNSEERAFWLNEIEDIPNK